jgi:hypothetical protein
MGDSRGGRDCSADLDRPVVTLRLVITDVCDGALGEWEIHVIRPRRASDLHIHAVSYEKARLAGVLQWKQINKSQFASFGSEHTSPGLMRPLFCSCGRMTSLALLGLLMLAWNECTHQLALLWGTRHLISPELAGNIVTYFCFFL